MLKYKMGVAERVGLGINFLVVTFLGFITLYPFYYIVIGSVAPISDLTSGRFLLLPSKVSFDAYGLVLKNPLVPSAYLNTIFITVVGTAISMFLSITGAYVLSKKYLPGRIPLTFLLVFTLLFNGGLIPTFLTVKAVGLLDSIWALILPTSVSVYNTVVMRNFFMKIPPSIEESVSLDGANHVTILTKIIIPLSTPVIAAISLFYAVTYWNSFFNAVIYINDRRLWPLQLVLREVLIQGRTDELMNLIEENINIPTEVIKRALIVVTVVPILMVYPFLQKFFVKGLVMGSVKG